MADNQDEISRAKAQVETAWTGLFEAYFSEIRETYRTLDQRGKNFVLKGLEALVTSIEERSVTERLMIFSGKGITLKNVLFDRIKAKEIRFRAGLTQSALAKELGLEGDYNAQASISRYECGRATPRNPPKGKISKEYMEWLKKQGYDPYGL